MNKQDYFEDGDEVLINGVEEIYIIRSVHDDILEIIDSSGDFVGFYSINSVELL